MKSAISFLTKTVFCAAVMCAAACILSCKSAPKNSGADGSGSNQITGQWQENEMSDTVQTGYFYTGDELKDFSSAEVEFKKKADTQKALSALYSVILRTTRASFRPIFVLKLP